MTPEERFERIERNLEATTEHQVAQRADIDKMLDAAGKLVVVGRTCLDSIKELRESHAQLRESHEADYKKLLEAQAATDEKLNILIDTVDRIIRHRNGKE